MDDCIAAMRFCLECDKQYHKASFQIGRALAAQGRNEEAVKQLQSLFSARNRFCINIWEIQGGSQAKVMLLLLACRHINSILYQCMRWSSSQPNLSFLCRGQTATFWSIHGSREAPCSIQLRLGVLVQSPTASKASAKDTMSGDIDDRLWCRQPGSMSGNGLGRDIPQVCSGPAQVHAAVYPAAAVNRTLGRADGRSCFPAVNSVGQP